MSKQEKRLRLAGLIVGLVGLIEFTLAFFFFSEGGPGWWTFLIANIYILPLLIGIIIAWKRPLVGGLALIGIVLFWLIINFASGLNAINHQDMFLLYLERVGATLLLFLPQLVTGILFLLSWKAERAVRSSYIQGEPYT